jgi:ferritin
MASKHFNPIPNWPTKRANLSKSIYELVDMAGKQKDYSTYSFLQWFVTEQIEEETLFQTILHKFDLLGNDKLAIYQIDSRCLL